MEDGVRGALERESEEALCRAEEEGREEDETVGGLTRAGGRETCVREA